MLRMMTMNLTNEMVLARVDVMPIPFPLDHTIDRLRTRHSYLLLARILEHKWLMSERMGRDVGMRVATIDYLENGGLQPPCV